MGNSILHKENSTHGMFYIKKDKGIASELNYKLHNDIMTIDHTETKPEFEGRGLGSKLVEEAVNYARQKNFKINPKKINYIYVLTPKEISEKTRLTVNFMKRKMKEYDELHKELKEK